MIVVREPNSCNISATLHATVSASFVIEQFGLPSLTISDGIEKFNGDDPHERLKQLAGRMKEREARDD
jgi:hypothetical protein